MSPATSTVLWNMLIQRMSQIRMTIDVSPVETIRKFVSVDVRVRQRRMKLLTIQVPLEDLILIVTLNFAVGMGGNEGGSH